MRTSDIIIIGCGPGGMEAAAEALKAGLDTVVIERSLLGGTCLNRGCIPTKALCRSAAVARDVKEAAGFGINVESFSLDFGKAIERKDNVVAGLRDNVALMLGNAEIVNGEARFTGPHTIEVDGKQYSAPKIIIATGSKSAMIPIEGAELAIDSDSLLDMKSLPASMCIIGGGVIGLEFASILNEFGVEVTVVEFCKEILPNFDKDIAKRLRTSMSRSGVKFITQAKVTSIRQDKSVVYECKGKTSELQADEILMAIGRRPVIPAGVEEAGIELERGAIKVDKNFMTTVEGVYAVGDVNAVMMLAHVASAQAVNVMGGHINLDIVPAAVFTHPECSMVGLTEETCKETGLDIKVAKAMFRGNGKALAMGEGDGIVKLIIDATNRKILGCHICGPHAADLIQEVVMAMNDGDTVDRIADSIHGHPTLSEVVSSAASML